MRAPVGADGSFEISGVPPGTRTLKLGQNPFVAVGSVRIDDDVKGLVVLGGRVTAEDGSVLTKPATTSTLVALTAEAYNVVPGRPLPLVTARGVVQADGSFNLILPEGEHRLQLRNVPFTYDVRTLVSGNIDLLTTPLRVSSATTLTEIRAELVKRALTGVKVSGRLTGFPASIISGTVIHLQSGRPGNHIGSALTRQDGTFEFPAVPLGTYSVSVLNMPVLTGQQTAVVNPRTWWIQVANEDISDIEFPGMIFPGFLDGGAFLSSADVLPKVNGRVSVVDETGMPLAVPSGVMILLAGGSPSLTNIRPDGTFEMPATNGEHRIAFTGLPTGYAIKTMSRGATDLTNIPLLVDPSGSSEQVRITLEFKRSDAAEGRTRIVGGVISGRLLNGDGTPAKNLQVHAAANAISQGVVRTLTDDAGNYRLENVPPGQYIIIVGTHPTAPSPLASRIVKSGGAQTTASDPPLQISIGYGNKVDLGTATAVPVNQGNRSSTFYRIQSN